MSQTGDPFKGLRFEPYEDTVIATFSLALGFVLGWRSGREEQLPDENPDSEPSPQATVTDLQRTPFDTSMGDVVTTVRNRGLLIEFKRTVGQAVTEPKKEKKYGAILTIPQTHEVSARQAHWFAAKGYQQRRDGRSSIVFLPYPELPLLLKAKSRRGFVSMNSHDLQTFIDCFIYASNDPVIGVELDVLREYLQWLRSQGDQDSGEDFAGFALVCDRFGRLHLVEARSLSHLISRVQHASLTPEKGGMNIDIGLKQRTGQQVGDVPLAPTTEGESKKRGGRTQ